MDTLSISITVGILSILLSAFIPKKQLLINKYKNMKTNELVASKNSVKKLNIIFLVLAFLVIPVLMGFVMPKFGGSQAYNIILSVSVFSLLLCIALGGFFQRCSKIIDSELGTRS